MKKKLIVAVVAASMMALCLTGCQKEDQAPVSSAQSEGSAGAEQTAGDNKLQVCSGCQEEKECQTYTVDGQDYIVCDDCYDEFATGMGLNDTDNGVDTGSNSGAGQSTAALQTCSGCQEKKECQTYTVDGQDYIVCDDCYDEFATGMGLKDVDNGAASVQKCSGCEEEKECQIYTVDGQDYIVCDDCYDEFASGMGLK